MIYLADCEEAVVVIVCCGALLDCELATGKKCVVEIGINRRMVNVVVLVPIELCVDVFGVTSLYLLIITFCKFALVSVSPAVISCWTFWTIVGRNGIAIAMLTNVAPTRARVRMF